MTYKTAVLFLKYNHLFLRKNYNLKYFIFLFM